MHLAGVLPQRRCSPAVARIVAALDGLMERWRRGRGGVAAGVTAGEQSGRGAPSAVATSGLPSRMGTPAATAMSLATCLSAKSDMVLPRGPSHCMPAPSTAATNSGLSLRKP